MSEYLFSFVMIRLGSFMHIYVFIKTSKQMKSKQRFVLLVKYYKEYYTFDMLFIFLYYMHSIHFCTFKFRINV